MAKKLAKTARASARQKSTRTTNGKRQSRRPSRPAKPRAHKGGPVPGTPSPMRTRMSPELQAHVRRLYEETDQPVCQIALDVGVNESVIRRMGPREGWVRFEAPPRDLPPVATLLAQVEELERSSADPNTPTPDRSSRSSPDGERPLAYGGGEQEVRADGGEKQDNIARFIRVVMAHLDEFEAMRRDGKLLPKHHLATARAISILTEAFNTLQRLRAAQPRQNHDDLSDRYADRYDVLPADLDEYRLALTRRIQEFLRSRAAAGAGGGAAAEPAEGA